jgi:pilus assembly protein Flp/PilA
LYSKKYLLTIVLIIRQKIWINSDFNYVEISVLYSDPVPDAGEREYSRTGVKKICGTPDMEHLMTTMFKRFLKNESGATAIEYALIAALIGVALIGTLQALRGNMQTSFNSIGAQLTAN